MDNEYYQKIFSDNLKKLMEENEKSQVDLIKDLGFTRSAISTWCNGTRLPRMDKVDALANYFHVKRSDLIEEESVPNEESLAAHFDGEDFSEDEKKEILAFVDYIKSKREK